MEELEELEEFFIDKFNNINSDEELEDMEELFIDKFNNINSVEDLEELFAMAPQLRQIIIDTALNASAAPKKRKSNPRPNYWQSVWGKMLLDKDIKNPSSALSEKFRARFRVPFALFENILVPSCKFFSSAVNSIPVEFKVLIGLGMLGRDFCADECSKCTGIGASTVNQIFHEFVKGFSAANYDKYVYIPSGEDLVRTMEVYQKMGLPGCIASIDCTHIKWTACPKKLKGLCRGKDGCPMLSFQVCADHSRRILHVSLPVYGETNDKTIYAHDAITMELLADKFKDLEYVLHDGQGEETFYKGAYILCENGNPPYACLIAPRKTDHTMASMLWSKDIECVFDILISRWRFLRNGIKIHDPECIYDIMRTVAILHNMLLEYDGLDNFNDEHYWSGLSPDYVFDAEASSAFPVAVSATTSAQKRRVTPQKRIKDKAQIEIIIKKSKLQMASRIGNLFRKMRETNSVNRRFLMQELHCAIKECSIYPDLQSQYIGLLERYHGVKYLREDLVDEHCTNFNLNFASISDDNINETDRSAVFVNADNSHSRSISSSPNINFKVRVLYETDATTDGSSDRPLRKRGRPY